MQFHMAVLHNTCRKLHSAWYAGTPLGDPIEVGALGEAMCAIDAAVSSSTPRLPRVLTLGSAKACFGHTEGAAGLTGALLALQPLARALCPPIMHLCALNPYVTAALGGWARHGPQTLTAALPRLLCPGRPSPGLCGTSSFGMSGVNAHALLAAPTLGQPRSSAAQGLSPVLTWRRARFWPHALAHAALAAAAAAATASTVFAMDLRAPALAFLGDCRLAGRAQVPAAALLEAAAAACQALLGGGAATWTPLLLHACISSPMPWHPQPACAHEASDAAPRGGLECRVGRSSGDVTLATGDSRHLAASAQGDVKPAHRSPGQAGAPLWCSTIHALVSGLLPQRRQQACSSGSCVSSVVAPAQSPPGQFLVHPALLVASAALPCAAGECPGAAGSLASCHAFHVEAGLPEALPCSTHATASSGSAMEAAAAGSLADVLCSAARLAGARLAPLQKQALQSADEGGPAYQLRWQALAVPQGHLLPEPAAPTRWLVLSSTPWLLERMCHNAPAWLSVCNLIHQRRMSSGLECTAEACSAVSLLPEEGACRLGFWETAQSQLWCSSQAQLEAALIAAGADHIFCVQGEPVEHLAGGAHPQHLAEPCITRTIVPLNKLCMRHFKTMQFLPYLPCFCFAGLMLLLHICCCCTSREASRPKRYDRCLMLQRTLRLAPTCCCGRSGQLCAQHRVHGSP